MLPKKRRVSKQVFKELRKSQSFVLPNLTLRVTNLLGDSQIAFVVSKKIAKTAVLRNKLRRRGYNATRKITSRLKDGKAFIFYIQQGCTNLSTNDLSKEIEKALGQKGFLKN